MSTLVAGDVEELHGSLSQGARCFFADQCEDTAVVVSVGVNVKKVVGDSRRQFVDDATVAPFTDVDDAFEHPSFVANKWG